MQKKKSAFSETDVKNMLKLEELFHSKFLTEELLNELTSLYVKAIDCVNDKVMMMKKYFLQKMQFVLSRPQISKLLQTNETQNTEIQNSYESYKIKISSLEYEYSSPTFVIPQKSVKQIPSPKLHQLSLSPQRRTQLLNEKIELQIQMMREVESNMRSLITHQIFKSNHKFMPIDQIIQTQSINLLQVLQKNQRKLRKKSADFTEISLLKEQLRIDENSLSKEDLLRAHAQLEDKFERFIFNATRKNFKLGVLKVGSPIAQQSRGRVKTFSFKEEDEDDWGFAKKKNQLQLSGKQNQTSRTSNTQQKGKMHQYDFTFQQSFGSVQRFSYPQLPQMNEKSLKSKQSFQPQTKEIEVNDNDLAEDDYF